MHAHARMHTHTHNLSLIHTHTPPTHTLQPPTNPHTTLLDFIIYLWRYFGDIRYSVALYNKVEHSTIFVCHDKMLSHWHFCLILFFPGNHINIKYNKLYLHKYTQKKQYTPPPPRHIYKSLTHPHKWTSTHAQGLVWTHTHKCP